MATQGSKHQQASSSNPESQVPPTPQPEDLESPPPSINVRYFYVSPLDIDDKQAPVPPLSSSSYSKHLPRPFSSRDNDALEKAWIELNKNLGHYEQEKAKERERQERKKAESRSATPAHFRRSRGNTTGSARNQERRESLSRNLGRNRAFEQYGSPPTAQHVESPTTADQARSPPKASPGSPAELPERLNVADISSASFPGDAGTDDIHHVEEHSQGLTGNPFVRAPSRPKVAQTWQPSRGESQSRGGEDQTSPSRASIDSGPVESKENTSQPPQMALTVGVSRLHQIRMPDLVMEPVYWQPFHDNAKVQRATWFYKDTMLPVEPEVADMLEAGYVDLRVWTQTWQDELESALTVGAVGEEKVAHTLWPKTPPKVSSSRPATSMSSQTKEEEDTPDKTKERARKKAREVINKSTAPSDDVDNKAAGKTGYGNDGHVRVYSQSAIIYSNHREAFILRPSLQPSAYYGRRPLANYIRKGHRIGISVIRGYDETAWERIHPSRRSKAAKKERPTNLPGGLNDRLEAEMNTKVTDLILIIHGIGQKWSERDESFNFTYAMNAFRREVNIELDSTPVKKHLRRDMGGVMVLPVNWRTALSFEDGGYRDGPDLKQFTLKDITPESLPSVRNVVSDVLLDIPYYMSHHRGNMIQAVISEANRLYRLWCKNNPGFDQYGRVHLIAHSLGSVMAMDVLSDQPTHVDPTVALSSDVPTSPPLTPQHFCFNTTNLFLCGSPAGFFLLLNKATLLPRSKDASSSASSPPDTAAQVHGGAGTYGCLAVSNIYNIINPYDPVAYRLNAAIDTLYASSLRSAVVPSASKSWFAASSFNPFKSSAVDGGSSETLPVATGSSTNISSEIGGATSPAPGFAPSSATDNYAATSISGAVLGPRGTLKLSRTLPSQVELETHNFSREELAEERAHRLNDTGQIDFFLRCRGGQKTGYGGRSRRFEGNEEEIEELSDNSSWGYADGEEGVNGRRGTQRVPYGMVRMREAL
ncbi:MAG: hypothetical protein M1831_001501 [Alyxoria varia]|nr:MAG: hypothetical protein M1831_001501 [Alyxoria varia]